jgi:hypothetical protein
MDGCPFSVNIGDALLFRFLVSKRDATKKEPQGKPRGSSSNREASNRVDRSHSENPDDWIAIVKIRAIPLPIG